MIDAHPATKWRHGVAMGVSLWNRIPRANSPAGTTGTITTPIHVAPLGLRVRFDHQAHGFAPVAKTCRPFGTNVLTPGREGAVSFAEKMATQTFQLTFRLATKWRHDVAMGVSPWNRIPPRQ